MPSPTNDDVWTERDLDDALQAGRDAARDFSSVPYRAGFIQGIEFYHRYLLERRRLTTDPSDDE